MCGKWKHDCPCMDINEEPIMLCNLCGEPVEHPTRSGNHGLCEGLEDALHSVLALQLHYNCCGKLLNNSPLPTIITTHTGEPLAICMDCYGETRDPALTIVQPLVAESE